MASAVQHLTECTICTETFTDPRVLPCDHTFCKECIERVQRGQKVKCPICNESHEAKSIRPDFRLTQFLDALHEQQRPKDRSEKKQDTEEPLCDLYCSLSANWWCEDCKQWMCKSCKNMHKRIAACETHNVVPIALQMQAMKDEFEKESVCIEEALKQCREVTTTIEEKLKHLQTTQADAVDNVEKIRQDILKEINDYCDSIVARINEHVSQWNIDLESQQNDLAKKLNILETKFSAAKQMIKHNARSLATKEHYLLDELVTLAKEGSCNADLNDIKINVVNKWKINPHMLDVECKEFVVVAPTLNADVDIQPSGIAGKRFALEKTIKLKSSPWGLRLINGKLWVTQSSRVDIFTTNLDDQESINWQYGSVYDVANTSDGKVVLVSNQGIFHVSNECIRIATIDTGNCISAVAEGNRLYAYKKDADVLQAYNSHQQWQKDAPILVDGPGFITLGIYRQEIALCKNSSQSIRILKQNGEFVKEFDGRGTGLPGQFSNPFLGDIGKQGELLVCDRVNNQIHRLDIDDCWSYVNLEPAASDPLKALYYDHKLYVISNRDHMLHMYREF